MREIGKKHQSNEECDVTPNSKKRRVNNENNGEKLNSSMEKKFVNMSITKRNLHPSSSNISPIAENKPRNVTNNEITVEEIHTEGKLTYLTPNKNAAAFEHHRDKNAQSTQKAEKPLKDVIAYVEVQSGHYNCTVAFQEDLQLLGAKLSEKFNKQVTHVVFKDGRKSTYTRAVNSDVHLVSVLWVNACKLSWKHLPEKDYPAIVSEAYTSPYFVGRLRKLKTLHPDDPLDAEPRSAAYYDRKRQLREWRLNRADLFKPTSLPDILSRIRSEKAQASASSTKITSPPSPIDRAIDTLDNWDNVSCHSDEEAIQPLARRLFAKYPHLPTIEYLSDYTNKLGLNILERSETEITEDDKVDERLELNANSVMEINSTLDTKKTKKKLKRALREIDENVSVAALSQPGIIRKSLDDFKLPNLRKEEKKLDVVVKKIVLTSFHSEERESLKKIILKLGVYSTSSTVDQSTTHVISGDGRRTLNILFAITNGCWILNSDWIYKSSKSREWLSEEPFEMSVNYPAAKVYRLEKCQIGPDYKCGIFQEMGPIFIARNSSPPYKDLKNLLKCSSATVVKCHSQARIVLGMAVKNCASICVKETWALDCITNAKILPTDDYLLNYKSPQ